ncbi:MAG: hypothetical protein AB3N20_03080 [Rhizobiaceae bacterium]
MNRILTLSLSAFWAIFFALQSTAMLSMLVAGKGTTAFPGLSELVTIMPIISAGLAGVFALTSAVFLWTAGASFLIAGPEGARALQKAVTVAVLTLSLVCVVSHAIMSISLFEALGLYIAGLAGTFAAAGAETLLDSEEQAANDAAMPARVMALSAAHNSLLGQISGRIGPGRGEN